MWNWTCSVSIYGNCVVSFVSPLPPPRSTPRAVDKRRSTNIYRPSSIQTIQLKCSSRHSLRWARVVCSALYSMFKAVCVCVMCVMFFFVSFCTRLQIRAHTCMFAIRLTTNVPTARTHSHLGIFIPQAVCVRAMCVLTCEEYRHTYCVEFQANIQFGWKSHFEIGAASCATIALVFVWFYSTILHQITPSILCNTLNQP